LRDTPERSRRLGPIFPSDLERIVGRCLEKSPRDRAQTALYGAYELRRLKHSLDQRGAHQPAPEVASIAVLPFVTGAGKRRTIFSDGLADELLNVLAKIRGLRVAARASSFSSRARARTSL